MKFSFLFALLVGPLALGAAPSVTADVLSAPGVLTSGSGSRYWKQCSTCPNEGSNLSESDGGSGRPSALTQRDNVGDGYYWLAAGELLGPNVLPLLRARAEVKIAAPQIYASANASAQGLQHYSYQGASAGHYTVSFEVDGSLSGDTESINAGVSVFAGNYDPRLEGEGRFTQIGQARINVTANQGAGSFQRSGSADFDIGAGESFYVLAYLNASAYLTDFGGPPLNLPGVADASHTMRVAFTAGDTSMLVLASAVPEPPVAALMLLGGVGLGVVRRRGSSRGAKQPG